MIMEIHFNSLTQHFGLLILPEYIFDKDLQGIQMGKYIGRFDH